MMSGSSWVKRTSDGTGRMEECLYDFAYEPHKHAAYAFAITTQGVQRFHYRGAQRYALPEQVVILHPDEMHDGKTLPGAHFAYRGMLIDPLQVQDILQGTSLPFFDTGVTSDSNLVATAQAMFTELDQPLEILAYQELIFSFATQLQCLVGKRTSHTHENYAAIARVREYLDDLALSSMAGQTQVSLDLLAHIANYSKWQVTRDFRSLYGTTPYHYFLLKKLFKARALIERGHTVSHVSQECGFSDQSHLNRQFKKCFGITPKKWYKKMV